MSWLSWPTAEGWAAIATFLAVLVAVFQDVIRQFVRSRFSFLQPDLRLELIEQSRWEQIPIKGINCGAWTYYGEVRNANSKAATQVQVILLNLQEIPEDESECATIIANVPIQWRLRRIRSLEATIGQMQEFPVCSLIRRPEGPEVRTYPVTKILHVKRTWRQSVKAVMTLQAKSIEAESNRLSIEIEWDGQWSDDKAEIVKHLKVREIVIDNEESMEGNMANEEDNQRLIAAGKLQRWEVLKWVTTVNMGLATASAFVSRTDGKLLVWEFLSATILMALFGLSLLLHYNKRITGVRREAGGYGGFFYDWPELLVFGIVIVLSPVPALLIALK